MPNTDQGKPLKPIRLTKHAREQSSERGTNEAEIVKAVVICK